MRAVQRLRVVGILACAVVAAWMAAEMEEVSVAAETRLMPLTRNSLPLCLGGSPSGGVGMTGSIAEPLVWERALSPDELDAVFHGARPQDGLLLAFDVIPDSSGHPIFTAAEGLAFTFQVDGNVEFQTQLSTTSESGVANSETGCHERPPMFPIFVFDGKSRIRIQPVDRFDGADRAMTIACWVRPESGEGRIFDKMPAGGSTGFLLDLLGNIRFHSNSFSIRNAPMPKLGSWVHVAAVFSTDDGCAEVFLNGHSVSAPPFYTPADAGIREVTYIPGVTEKMGEAESLIWRVGAPEVPDAETDVTEVATPFPTTLPTLRANRSPKELFTVLAKKGPMTLSVRMIPQQVGSSMNLLSMDEKACGRQISISVADEMMTASVDGVSVHEYWKYRYDGTDIQVILVVDDQGRLQLLPDGEAGPRLRNSLCPTTPLTGPSEDSLVIWADRPGDGWNDAYVLGNGSFGAMVTGGVASDVIWLNEETLWSGKPQQYQKTSYREALPEVRRLILEGKTAEADSLGNRELLGPYFTNYLPLGYVVVNYPEFSGYGNGGDTESDRGASDYRRSLDLTTGVATTQFVYDGVSYRRETFVSYPDQAMFYRTTADQNGKISLDVDLRSVLRNFANDSHPGAGSSKEIGGFQNVSVIVEGYAPTYAAPNYLGTSKVTYTDGEGTTFAIMVRAFATGGTLSCDGDRQERIVARNCDTVTFVVTGATSFNGPDRDPRREGCDPVATCKQRLHTIAESFENVSSNANIAKNETNITNAVTDSFLARHVADHRSLFDRFRLRLETKKSHSVDYTAIPTRERAANFVIGEDNNLLALYAQFGRYLLIASSRPGTHPANLQGIWNRNVNSIWSSNYTTNCNCEINYWPCESANLSECHLPMETMVRELVPDGERTALICYGTNGWVVHHNVDIWRTTTAVDGSVSWAIFPIANAWLTQDLMEHYRFTGDREFLARIWQLLKGAAVFQMENLQTDPKTGDLVLCPDINFENSFRRADGTGGNLCAGSTPSMFMLRQLLENVVEASSVLSIEPEFRTEAERTLIRLAPIPISERTGELMEWREDVVAVGDNSQMLSVWGITCSNQVSRWRTPELATAMKRMIDARRRNGLANQTATWQGAFQTVAYARLGRSDDAADILQRHLRTVPHPNMTAGFSGEIWEIDGNLGQTAGLLEMFVQSQNDEIELLPALPVTIPDGEISGLCARGGFEISMTWKDGRLISGTILSRLGHPCQLRYEGQIIQFDTAPGERYDLSEKLNGR